MNNLPGLIVVRRIQIGDIVEVDLNESETRRGRVTKIYAYDRVRILLRNRRKSQVFDIDRVRYMRSTDGK